MSALGGILNFQPVGVSSMVLNQLWHSLSPYGPDSGDVVSNGSVGMVYRGLNSTPESRQESQPITSGFGQMLVWDGRLDNRADLLPHLQQRFHTNIGCITDVSIVMAAYQRWGFDFLPRIIGDFALAMWEPRTRTLALARDPFGVRSLFYHVDEDRITWSSILRELLEVTDVRPEVNDEYIAGFLTRYPEPSETPYKGFFAVPPGQLVIVQNGEVSTSAPYWKPDPDACLLYRRPEEYEERFRHELMGSVRCRLRTNGPAFAELSGGLDSSSIVCAADQVIREDHVGAPSLETVSYVYDEARSSDERSFIHSVEEHRGKRGHHINEDDFRFLTPSAEEVFFSAPSYHYYYFERFKALRKLMAQHGSRVILSGEGGDQLNFSNPDPDIIVADYMSSWSFFRLHRLLRDWSRGIKKPYLQILWSGLVLQLPRSLQIRYMTIAQPPPWLDSQFQKQMNIADRMLGPPDFCGYRLPSRRDHMEGILSVVRTISAIYFQEYAGVEYTFPYLHRPLVEFLLAVPIEQKIRPGEGRWLVRRALREMLPAKVANRKGKKGPTAALSKAVAREWPRLKPIFDNPRVCAYGYVNYESLMIALERVRHGAEKFSFHLFVTIATEFWLRSLERRSSSISRSIATHPRLTQPDQIFALSGG